MVKNVGNERGVVKGPGAKVCSRRREYIAVPLVRCGGRWPWFHPLLVCPLIVHPLLFHPVFFHLRLFPLRLFHLRLFPLLLVRRT